MKKKVSIKNLLLDSAVFLLGSVLYAVAVDVFTAPNNIAPGGVTGISTIIGNLFDLPIGTLIIIFNIPLLIASFFVIGRRYTLKTLIFTFVSSIAIDLLDPLLSRFAYTQNPLLAAIFGGLITGIALGLAFTRGGSTGGTDIVARLISMKLPHFTQGNLIMLTDAVVIAVSAVFFGLEAALFAVIAVFICGQVIDRILYGADTGKLLIIVTRDVSKVSAAIMSTLDRGATLLRGEGAFSGSEQDVILCAVRRSEVYRVRGLVRGIDKSAFMVVCDASEILGEGFRAIDTNEFGETVDDDN